MRHLFTIIVLLVVTTGYGQSNPVKDEVSSEVVKKEGFSVTLDVHSAEELESKFKTIDIKEILSLLGEFQKFTFEIICNEENSSGKLKQKISFKLDGNSTDINDWTARIEKMKTLAIAFYKNKQ